MRHYQLTKNHANPDYARYELRRVWVLEGTLKEGFRHLYGKLAAGQFGTI